MNDKLITWEESVQWLRNQPDKQRLVSDCYYDDPLSLSAERFSNSEEWNAIKEILKHNIPGRVLDLGAGRGISSYAFAKAGCSVTALEPDPSPLVGAKAIESLAYSTGVEIEIVQEFGEKLAFAENSFDIVYGRAVLHHARNLEKLCQEVARVLKPKGIFLFTREHVISKPEDIQQFLNNHPLHHLYGGENAYLLKDYIRSITRAGLKSQAVLGPFESVINYAPTTRKEFQAMIRNELNKRFGSRLASRLASLKKVQQFFGWYLSRKSQHAGREYSFLAVKP